MDNVQLIDASTSDTTDSTSRKEIRFYRQDSNVGLFSSRPRDGIAKEFENSPSKNSYPTFFPNVSAAWIVCTCALDARVHKCACIDRLYLWRKKGKRKEERGKKRLGWPEVCVHPSHARINTLTSRSDGFKSLLKITSSEEISIFSNIN
ncbi:uncharacterized protein LOC143146518 isoform X2 [Ptiloglossa arizonensis]|uniref:uncharacterized protein LOC143146518 isoform X2 n=1 Tax=Ptiloglossa arizonensis TaxID=3350558 RepID=UPI003FA149BB